MGTQLKYAPGHLKSFNGSRFGNTYKSIAELRKSKDVNTMNSVEDGPLKNGY